MNIKLSIFLVMSIFITACGGGGGNGNGNVSPPSSGSPDPVEESEVVEVGALEDGVKSVSTNILNLREGEILVDAVVSEAPENGVARIATDLSRVEYTPNQNFFGNDQFEFRINTNQGRFKSALVKVYVENVNDPPVVRDEVVRVIVKYGEELVGVSVSASDVDGDVLTAYIKKNLDNGNVVIASGRIDITLNPDFIGEDNFQIAFSDGEFEDVTTVHITVLPPDPPPPPPNNPPTLTCPNGGSVMQGQSTTTQCSAQDQDQGDTLTFSISQAPAYGVASVDQNGLVTYTADSTYVGNVVVGVKVFDQGNLFSERFISIDVLSNTPPSFICFDIHRRYVVKGDSITFRCNMHNPNRSLSISQAPAYGVASVNQNGLITYTADSTYVGSISFVVRLTDEINGLSSELEINVSVVSASKSEIICPSGVIEVYQNTLYKGKCEVVNPPPGGAILWVNRQKSTTNDATISSHGDLLFASDILGQAIVVVEFMSSDPMTDGVSASVTFNVVPKPNNPPTLSCGDMPSITQGGFASLFCTASDQDDDALTFSISQAPAYGVASVNQNGFVAYTADNSYFGPVQFEVSVFDGELVTTQLISFNVDELIYGVVPFLSCDVQGSVMAYSGQESLVNCTAVDVLPSNAFFKVVAQPQNGVASVDNNGVVSYTPNAGYVGSDTLSITVESLANNAGPSNEVFISFDVIRPVDGLVAVASDYVVRPDESYFLMDSDDAGNVAILFVHCFENNCTNGQISPLVVRSYDAGASFGAPMYVYGSEPITIYRNLEVSGDGFIYGAGSWGIYYFDNYPNPDFLLNGVWAFGDFKGSLVGDLVYEGPEVKSYNFGASYPSWVSGMYFSDPASGEISFKSWVGSRYCTDHLAKKSPDGVIHAIARCDSWGGFYHVVFDDVLGFGEKHFIASSESIPEKILTSPEYGSISFFDGCMYFTHEGVGSSDVVEKSCDDGVSWQEVLSFDDATAELKVQDNIWLDPANNNIFRLEDRQDGLVLVEYVFDSTTGTWSLSGLERTEPIMLNFKDMSSNLISDFSFGGSYLHFSFVDASGGIKYVNRPLN